MARRGHTSPYNNPTVLAAKNNEPLEQRRFCVDTSILNPLLQDFRHITPTIEAVIDKLGRWRKKSEFDFRSAFIQLSLAEDSKQFTAFTAVESGHYEFERLPFGIKISTDAWQHAIDLIFTETNSDWLVIYVDNLYIDAIDEADNCEGLLVSHYVEGFTELMEPLQSLVNSAATADTTKEANRLIKFHWSHELSQGLVRHAPS
jgi:hypothetical protein